MKHLNKIQDALNNLDNHGIDRSFDDVVTTDRLYHEDGSVYDIHFDYHDLSEISAIEYKGTWY